MPLIIREKAPCKICGKKFLKQASRKKICSKLCSIENIKQSQKKYIQNKRIQDPNYFKEANLERKRKKINGINEIKEEIRCSFCERKLSTLRKQRGNVKTCSKKCSLLLRRHSLRKAGNRSYQRRKTERLWLEVLEIINPELKRKLELKMNERNFSITKILEKALED